MLLFTWLVAIGVKPSLFLDKKKFFTNPGIVVKQKLELTI